MAGYKKNIFIYVLLENHSSQPVMVLLSLNEQGYLVYYHWSNHMEMPPASMWG